MMRRLFTAGIISLGLFSCDPLEEGPDVDSTYGIRHDKELSDYEAVATNNAPYNGTEYPDFSPVIKFCYSLNGSSNADYIGTGTLIEDQWILTAGHNFYVAEEQSSVPSVDGISVVVGDDPNDSDATYQVERLEFHPSWIEVNNDFLNGNDLCLVKLKTAVTNITPASVNLTLNTEVIGSEVWFCGYGDYSQQDGQDGNSLSLKHAYQNILDRRVDGVTSTVDGVTYNGGLLAYDFDDPDEVVNALGDDVVNSDESLLGSGDSEAGATPFEGATVQGDSGGPLFVKIDGSWVVAGVLSGGASDVFEGHEDAGYGDISVFIRTASHASWINSVIDQ